MVITNQIIDRMIAEYKNELQDYRCMRRYYDGDHDINYFYKKFPNRANSIIIDNFVAKFINEECQYSLGNPLSYVSLSGDKGVIDTIYKNTFHWSENHNQEVMKQLEIFGTVFLLNYIDAKGRFCERIITPLNGICYCDTDDQPQCFIHFYNLKYDESEYRDVYLPDGTVETWKDNSKIAVHKTQFAKIPVTVCKMDNINDTIFSKIKKLQDAYNQILSDQCNTIADYRNAYLVVTGVMVTEETEKDLKNHGLINLPSNGSSARWLTKDMPDDYIQNMLQNLKDSMYENTNHINGNEKLQSNTSGTALRNRLIFLEQRCNSMADIVVNAVYERVERLFDWLHFKNIYYDITDVKIEPNPYIPQDNLSIIQSLTQLGIGTNISKETALSQIPFVENPLQEIEKINAENAAEKAIDLDKIEGLGDG